MKIGRNGFASLTAGGLLVAALALGCGGGGGSGAPSSAGQIQGALSKTSGVRTASVDLGRTLFARASAWIGIAQAIAAGPVGKSGCGNPLDPAAAIKVTLFRKGDLTTPVDSTVTDSGGNFVFKAVPPGDYVIQVALAGKTISAPAIVQPSQTTNLTGELDVDCKDVDHDGVTSEPELHVEMDTDDGSMLVADETEHGGTFHGEVHENDGGVKMEDGRNGDRTDELDTRHGA